MKSRQFDIQFRGHKQAWAQTAVHGMHGKKTVKIETT